MPDGRTDRRSLPRRIASLAVCRCGIRLSAVFVCATLLFAGRAHPQKLVTVNAANCSKSAVQAAVKKAGSGDTVLVPAGNCTWDTSLTLPHSNDLTLKGAGIGHTHIKCPSGLCVQIDIAASHRVTGFTMSGPGGLIASRRNSNQNPDKYFRIDHNHLVSTGGTWGDVSIYGSSNGVHPQGLFDNNRIEDISIKPQGSNYGLDEAEYQHQLWAQQPPRGGGVGIVYIEDNTFVGTSANINWADSNYGGRYVFRFNTGSGKGYVEIHSVQGLNRAAQWWEIYKNTFSTNQWPGMVFARGGSGVIFGNRLPEFYGVYGITLDNVRSKRDPGGGVGRCNGSSNWDGNTEGQSGYPCRDQIGRSYDIIPWSPGQSSKQPLTPAYFWDNLSASRRFQVDNRGQTTWIKEDRDYYNYTDSFDGTRGVGSGTLGERPTTCTTGVAYWATDQGDWNSRQSGPDGQLYMCTATNNWVLYYTPYTYPHPFQAGSTTADRQ